MRYDGSTTLGCLFSLSREKGKAGLTTFSVTLQNGLVNRESIDRKTDSSLAPEDHWLVKDGYIAYNMMRMWQGASGMAFKEGLVSPAYVVLAPKSNIDSRYASYLFKTPRMIYLFWAYSYGLTKDRLRLYFQDFCKIPVTIPPISEQVKISTILSVWDQAIEKVDKLIENSQKHRKALMQCLLTGEKRLSSFNGNFSRMQMRDIADIDAHSLNNKTPDNFEFRYISLSDVEHGRISDTLEEHTYVKSPSRARRIVAEGDILMATVRPNLQSFAMIDSEHVDCIASTGFAVISPKQGFHGGYIYHYLFGSHVTGQIHSLVVGSNYPAINSSDVKGLAIYCPEHKEQIAISNALDNADKTISNLHRQLVHLKIQKKALMQQLLTGKRRVKVA